MEIRIKKINRDVFWDGFKSLIFPTLKLSSTYSLNDISTGDVRKDYRKSTKEMKREVVEFERRATTNR